MVPMLRKKEKKLSKFPKPVVVEIIPQQVSTSKAVRVSSNREGNNAISLLQDVDESILYIIRISLRL